MSKRQSKLTARQLALLDELPYHNWDFAEAGLAAGYSKSTCEKQLSGRMMSDVGFCRELDKKRRRLARLAHIGPQVLIARFNKIYRLAVKKGDLASAIQANVNLGKHLGFYAADNAQQPQSRPIQIAVFTGSPSPQPAQLSTGEPPVLEGEVVPTQERGPAEAEPKERAEPDQAGAGS